MTQRPKQNEGNAAEIFKRQVGVSGIGEDGQSRLVNAKVLVIGGGGLGSPVITYLASAGVGTIFVADGDAVELSNLNRQFLHGIDDVGQSKADSAVASARRINGQSTLVAIESYLSGSSLDEAVRRVDCVVDCVDSDVVRVAVGRACLKAGIPLVEAGVHDLYGWVLCIDRAHACLECAGLRTDVVSDAKPPVLGALVGIIGAMQALECIKILTGSPDVEYGALVNFDGVEMETEKIILERSDACVAHGFA